MTSTHNIEKQEAELKGLLNRVMAAPLQSIKDDFESKFEILEEIEEQIKELRENDLTAIKSASEKSERKLKSLIEDDLSGDVKQGFSSLIELQKSTLAKTQTHLVTHIDTVQAQANENTVQLINGLQNSLNSQHDKLVQLQHQNLEELNSLQKSQQSTLEQTQAHLIKHIDTVQARANESTVQLISALAVSNNKLENMLKMQYEQILQLQQKNAALTVQFEKKLPQSFLSMKQWIITTASLAGIGAIEVGVAISRHLF